MPTVPIAVTVPDLSVPNNFTGTTQDLLTLITSQLRAGLSVNSGSTGTYIAGGTMPTSDQGPWLPAGSTEFWYWDNTYGAYFPGGLPAGTIVLSFKTSPGANFLNCDGQTQPQANYRRLWDAIGYNGCYGGASSTDQTALSSTGLFRIPDFRGRTPIGVGSGSGLTPWSMGNLPGSEKITLTAAEIPTLPISSSIGGRPYTTGAGANTDGSLFHTIVDSHFLASSSLVSGDPADNTITYINATPTGVPITQPSIVSNFWIRY